MKKRINKNIIYPYLIFFAVVILIVTFFSFTNRTIHQFSYDKFIKELNNEKVGEINIAPKQRSGIYVIRGRLKGYGKRESFILNAPISDKVITQILENDKNNKENNFKISVTADPDGSTWLNILVNVLPIIIIGGGLFWVLSKQISIGGKSMDFSKSRAQLNENKKKVTFKDVAGLKEEKEEVSEIIDFLKEPAKFQKMGARIPKGLLLVGPPGTGKTLLAKAVAGEASVPFYFISGSDFVELFVGVGASRVRDMFKEAKRNAPCLIFIDEIDAVGRQRGSGIGGGHDEREQTLNQLLSEMDGFGENEGIIVMAATNRVDVLDPALLRPGRFDRQVTVDLPDKNERREILGVHAKNKILGPDVNLKNLAKRTPGFSGADLENLLNEAALLAVRLKKQFISMAEIDEATDRVIGGPAKVSRKYTEHEKKVVAFHEAGHAVLGVKLDHADEVHKITIIPRGQAGGYTLMLPKEETYLSTKSELLDQITGLLGGRISEEIEFNEITTGAHNDFMKATKIARSMVTEYGMSKLGPVQLERPEGSVFLGRDYNKSRDFSDQVALEIDKEVRSIVNECYERAKKILSANRDLIKLIADTLLEQETLNKEEIDSLVKTGKLPVKDYNEYTLEELKEMAKDLGLKGYSKLTKEELAIIVEANQSQKDDSDDEDKDKITS